MSKKNVTQDKVDSFLFYVAPGEALVYGSSTVTPEAGSYLSVHQGRLDQAEVAEWLVKSAEPLVGPKAARKFETLLKDKVAAKFLAATTAHLRSLKSRKK